MKKMNLAEAFGARDGSRVLKMKNITRCRWSAEGIERIRDDFSDTAAQCLFVRVRPISDAAVKIGLEGNYSIARCVLGGWLLEPPNLSDAIYWVPQVPILRTLDELGRITAERPAELLDLSIHDKEVSISLGAYSSQALDFAVWRLDGSKHAWAQELKTSVVLERQRYFVYASHTAVAGPADFYRHLIYGQIYGAAWSWPKRIKICDELDAYALYMVSAALEATTGKVLYQHLRQQVTLSVMCRQDKDGGFRHGEWTNQYESHNRLINGAVQLLASEVERTHDAVATQSLRRAAEYLSRQIDQTDLGPWILHDSLELSEEGIKHYPFSTRPSTWKGKSRTNLLIVNTHMDSMLALRRANEACGDTNHEDLLASAQRTLIGILTPQPAEWLYKPLMRLIGLTLLPKADQQRLPVLARALKRLTWKYLIPNWHIIRGRYPRFLMPGGYLERSLGQEGFVHRYHGVHLMDFERHLRKFPAPQIEQVSDDLLDFGLHSRVPQFWKEDDRSKDTLAFWAEGLFMRCLRSDTAAHRNLLAQSIIDLIDAGLGLPPSLLGVNTEIATTSDLPASPSPADARVRIVNLSSQGKLKFLAVNTAHEPIPLQFDAKPSSTLRWTLSGSDHLEMQIPSRGWVIGTS